MISRKYALLLITLLLVSPVFGVVLAEIMNYHEPLDVAAEELGLSEAEIEWTPFRDYAFPGLPDWAGYVVSGAVGVLLILAAGHVIKKLVVDK